MATWIGALVELPAGPCAAVLAAHGILVTTTADPWILVEVASGPIQPPAFAGALSQALGATVIGFAIQSAGCAEGIEHWHAGRCLRTLEHLDAPWQVTGAPQPWEPAAFFAPGGTADGDDWPDNLDEELSPADIARYGRARAAGAPAPVLDLLSGGSVATVRRLCAHLVVDPDRPAARVAR